MNETILLETYFNHFHNLNDVPKILVKGFNEEIEKLRFEFSQYHKKLKTLLFTGCKNNQQASDKALNAVSREDHMTIRHLKWRRSAGV